MSDEKKASLGSETTYQPFPDKMPRDEAPKKRLGVGYTALDILGADDAFDFVQQRHDAAEQRRQEVIRTVGHRTIWSIIPH